MGQSDLTVELIDYTFNQDTEEGNDTLSIARADALAAVLRALVCLLIKAGRVAMETGTRLSTNPLS